jgi:hypothetical protein
VRLSEQRLRYIIREALEDYEKFGVTDISDSDDAVVQLELDVEEMLNTVIGDHFSAQHPEGRRAFKLSSVDPKMIKKARAFFGKPLDLNQDGNYGDKFDWMASLNQSVATHRKNNPKKYDMKSRVARYEPTVRKMLGQTPNNRWNPKPAPEWEAFDKAWSNISLTTAGTLNKEESGYVFRGYHVFAAPSFWRSWDENLSTRENYAKAENFEYYGLQLIAYLELDIKKLRKMKSPYSWHTHVKGVAMYDTSQEDISDNVKQQFKEQSIVMIDRYRKVKEEREAEEKRLYDAEWSTKIMQKVRAMQNWPRDKYANEIDLLMGNILEIINQTRANTPEHKANFKKLLTFLSLSEVHHTEIYAPNRKSWPVTEINQKNLYDAIEHTEKMISFLNTLDKHGQVNPDLVTSEKKRQEKVKSQRAERIRAIHSVQPGSELEAVQSTQKEIEDDEEFESILKNIEHRWKELSTPDLRLLRKAILNFRAGNTTKSKNQVRQLVKNIEQRTDGNHAMDYQGSHHDTPSSIWDPNNDERR